MKHAMQWILLLAALVLLTPLAAQAMEMERVEVDDSYVDTFSFRGELPEELRAILAGTVYAGDEAVCGAYMRQPNVAVAGTFSEQFLLALKHEGATLLLRGVHRPAWPAEQWQLDPLSERFLDGLEDYTIHYWDSGEGCRTLWVRGLAISWANVTVSVSGYFNPACIQGMVIREDDGTVTAVTAAENFDVIVNRMDASGETLQYTKAPIDWLPHVEAQRAADLPASASAWLAFIDAHQPEKLVGYGRINGGNLRARPTSKSATQGIFTGGLPAEILGVEKNGSNVWYHVRVGDLEGYVAAMYFIAYEDEGGMYVHRSTAYTPVAQTIRETKLYRTAGGEPVTTLPEGQMLHVVGDFGGWQYVAVAQDEAGMRPEDTSLCGYVWLDDIVSAVSPLMLKYHIYR